MLKFRKKEMPEANVHSKLSRKRDWIPKDQNKNTT